MLALRALRRRASAAKINTFGSQHASHSTSSTDVIVVGAGHNGLIAATLMAQQGLKVDILEEKSQVGGACKTEHPFLKAPGLAQSTGAYLLGVMPPELIKLLDLRLALRRRDPHYFLPTTDSRYILFGSDEEATKQQFLKFFSEQDWEAHCELQNELTGIRDDIAPSWLAPPLTVEATALKFVRPELQEIYISLCRGSVRQYLDRFNFKSDLLKAMYATTDGFSGLTAGWDTPGGGFNFLVHNMCRLPGSNGTWMIVEGGMGQVTQGLATAATEAGVKLLTDCPVEKIEVDNASGAVVGVVAKGELRRAKAVVVNADPYRLQQLVGADSLPNEVNSSLKAMKRPGMTMKVNLALKALPQYSCLPEDHGQHRTTTHLLPDEHNVIEATERAFQDALSGKLPDFPTIEVYTQTAVDHKLQDSQHRHSAALFVQWVPNQPRGSTWEAEKDAYVAHLLSIWERFAPGISKLVDDVFPLAPPDIERHFGITGGHIHHIDNTYACADRFPHVVPGIEGLYSCSAGTHPAGSVIGAAGYNAAMAVKKDLLGS
jgi:phytoene dehydrogenase-like protein